MSAQLKRREFITLIGGAAAAWPLAAFAQQRAKLVAMGLLVPNGEAMIKFASAISECAHDDGARLHAR